MNGNASASRRGQTWLGRAVVFACAASAGAHAGLVPEHLREAPPLGISFVVAAGLLALAGVALVMAPANVRAVRATAVLLAGLMVAFVASRTTGLPLLQPEPEAPDLVGLATQVVEAIGLALALRLTHDLGDRRPPLLQEATR